MTTLLLISSYLDIYPYWREVRYGTKTLLVLLDKNENLQQL